MGLKKQQRNVYKSEHDLIVLAKVVKVVAEDVVGHNSGSSRFEMNEAPMNLVAL
jgi:hypothetical protein